VELLRYLHVQVSVSPSDLRASGLNHTDRLGCGGESCLAGRARRVSIIGLCQGEFFDPAGQLGVAVGLGEEAISEALVAHISHLWVGDDSGPRRWSAPTTDSVARLRRSTNKTEATDGGRLGESRLRCWAVAGLVVVLSGTCCFLVPLSDVRLQ
jgi:hypothetical protein